MKTDTDHRILFYAAALMSVLFLAGCAAVTGALA